MFVMNVDTRVEYAPGDPILIKNIVSQLKSQGVFDQFRKECISDVDTKPAYQNLCHRVDGRVESYLSDVKWGPDLNKNQLRENIRKHINEANFVESGISRIVDQLVNPRINTVLVPKVEDIVYSYLGIEKTEVNLSSNKDVKAEISDSVPINVFLENQKTENIQPDLIIKKENCSVSNVNRIDSTSNPQADPTSKRDDPYDLKNGIKKESSDSSSSNVINRNSVNACSDIDSDEDDLSPPFEPHEKSDVDLSAESDYSMDISDTKYDVKSEPSSTPKVDADNDKIFRNLEQICGEESMDSISSSCTDKINSRKVSLSSDLPRTPTINYETSDESQDNYSKKNNVINFRRESIQSEICMPDTSKMDSLVEKIVEDNREDVKTTIEDASSTSKMKNKEEKTTKSIEKERDETDASKHKRIESKSSDSKDLTHRSRKHSDHKRDKDRKSDKHEGSKNDKDRKSSKDKDRSNHESKNRTSKEKSDQNRDRKEHKDSSRAETDKSKIQRSHTDEKLSKDRDLKYKSSSSSDKHRSSDEKNKSVRTKSDDSRDDRKRKSSSSKHENEKDRERNKHRKEESSDVKRSKTQCGADEKKIRTDRRSSDRDSNGPSSSSRNSSHHSSKKTDKEKHRHSSSSTSSSSHKSKKSTETKDNDTAEESLFNKMMSVTGSVSMSCEIISHTKQSNIENTSSLLDILNDNDESKICSKKSNKSSVMETISKGTKSNEKQEDRDRCKNSEDDRRKTDELSKNNETKKKTDKDNREEIKNELSKSADSTTIPKRSSSLEKEILDIETKKPKIAKNAADILRIIELRKQYKEKMKSDQLMQEQGKENANLGKRKDSSSDEYDQKSILVERSVDNFISKKFCKNEKVVDTSEELTDPATDSFSDCKLKIQRVDAHYRLVNGACVVGDLGDEHFVSNNNDTIIDNNNAENKLKDSAEISSNRENYLKQSAQLQSRDTKMNGLLKDSVKMNVNVSEMINVNESNIDCDKDEIRRRSIIAKTCLLEEIDDVRYLEPTELNTDFQNFVAKRIKESEEMYLENFCIHLRCPERYDYIFRNQLGAIVKRKNGKSDLSSSPFKYNSEIINNKVGNEKGIMMRIKKTVQQDGTIEELPSEIIDSSVIRQDILPEHSTCVADATCDKSNNFVGKLLNNSANKVSSTKRKTLGIKRRFSSNSKRVGDTTVKTVNNTNGVSDEENPYFVVLGSKGIDSERTELGSCDTYDNKQFPIVPTQDSRESTGSSETNTSIVHSVGAPAPKIPKRISEESKRKQFYYDEGDLYKPRPSFLISSRRSRGLNPDKT